MFTKNSSKKFIVLALLTAIIFLCGIFAGMLGIFLSNTSSVAYAAQESYLNGTYKDSYYSGDYYNSLNESLTGDAFRSQLASLITTTHTFNPTYKSLTEIWKTTDVDPETGNVILFYTGTPSTSYNREHVWPKDGGAAFPAETYCGSDAHHLRPTDTTLNSTRGSLSFGETTQTVVKQAGSSSYGNLCYKNSSFFYPGKGFRGATARILFYVQTRWGDDYNLQFVEGSGSCKTIGDIATLMKWHLEEPPSEAEIFRNEEVFKLQGNRNPFIDHPEYAEMIYCNDGESYNTALKNAVTNYGSYLDEPTPIESLSISPSTLTLTVGATASLSVSAYPQGSNASATWTSNNSSVATVSNGKITAIGNGVATITATSVENTSVKATATITVKTLSSLTVSGTPTTTIYYEGETFDHTGLSVVGSYSDGSTETISNSMCQWLDGTTGESILAKGTTTITCKVGTITATVSGIAVKAVQGGTLTINRQSFNDLSSAYSWHEWTVGNVSGSAYIYATLKEAMQFNPSKEAAHIYNSEPLVGGIRTVTVYSQSGKTELDWELRTSSEPFAQDKSSLSEGTSRGVKTVTASGTKWEVSTTDKYFVLLVSGSSARYLDHIEIEYGIAGEVEDDTCEHSLGSWNAEVPATCSAEGVKGHYKCSLCEGAFDSEGNFISELEIAKLPHTEVIDSGKAPTCTQPGLTEGVHCSVCDTIITAQEVLPLIPHSDGNGDSLCDSCGGPVDAASAINYSYSFSAKVFDTAGTSFALGDQTWDLSAILGFAGYDSNKGQQIGSSGSPSKDLTISTTFEGKFNKVVVNMATASSANATLVVKVDGVEVGSTSLSTTATSYTFNFVTATDAKLELVLTQTTSKALYWKSIEVTCGCEHANTTITPAIEGTCMTEGFTQGVYCNDCSLQLSTPQSTGYGEHKISEYTTTVAPTCKDKGVEVGVCSVCGLESSREIPVSDNHDMNIWTSDGEYHWKTCACGEQEETDSMAEHTDTNSDMVCDVCNSEIVNDTEAALDGILALIEMPEVVTENFTLDNVATWVVKSGTAIVVSGNTAVVTRPTGADATVVLTATVSDGGYSRSKDFTVKVSKKEEATTTITASFVASEYATAHGWVNGTQYTEANIDSNITATANGGGNTGKYYTSGTNWRLYQSENATITISATQGTIVSVKVTYTSSNGGNLTLDGATIASGTAFEVNASSVTLTVGNSGTATNGQARITAIDVVYSMGGGSSPPDVCEHNIVVDSAVAPTCTATGLTEGSHCSICNQVITAQETVAALGHDKVSHDAVEATCTQKGNKAYQTCTRCDYTTFEEIPAKGHTEVVVNGTPATCTQTGLTDGVKCSVCGETITEQEIIPIAPHTEVVDNAVAPTCTTTGLTEGKHCSVCDTVIIAQTVVPKAEHTKVTISGTPATCTQTGLTEGVKCSVCGEVITAQEVIPTTSHTVVVDEAVAPTCEESGLTEGSHCSVCSTVITAQETVAALGHDKVSHDAVEPTCTQKGNKAYQTCTRCDYTTFEEIPAKGHTEVVVNGTPATCTQTGLTNGVKCSDCGEVITAQEIIPTAPHTEVVDNAVAPTCTATGLTEGKHCSVCDTVIIAQTVVPKAEHTKVTISGTPATCTQTGLTDGVKCSVCGEVITAQEVISTIPHTVVVDEAVAPTCEESGLTEGSHCSVCNKVIVPQNIVAKLGHTYEDGECSNCGMKDPSICTHPTFTFVPALAPTCVNTGNKEYYRCDVCGLLYADEALTEETTLEAQRIPATGHVAVIDNAVAPTCTATGLTEGKHCSVCEEIIIAQEIIDAKGHTEEAISGKAPTCTETGLTDGVKCTVCDEILVAQEEIQANGHTEVIDNAVAPTCTESGLTEGKHCSVCGTVIIAQTVVSAKGHDYTATITPPTCAEKGYTTYLCTCGDSYTDDQTDETGHTEIAIAGKPATCTQTGLTGGVKCSVCGEIIIEQEIIPTTDHQGETVNGTPATCTETGLTGGVKCSVCGIEIIEQEVIPAKGHTEVIDQAVAPTCTESGLTEGKRCSVCDEVILAQETIPAKGHAYTEKVTPPTCTEKGYTTYTCACGYSYTDDETSALGHVEEKVDGKPATCTQTGLTDGAVCSVCDTVITPKETIPAKGHTEVVDEAIQPTCSEVGLSEGKHCEECGEVTLGRVELPKIPHNFGDWKPLENGNREEVRQCADCGETETREVELEGNALAFIEKVEALSDSLSVSKKHEAINACITLYNGLTTQEKQWVAEEYQELIDFATSYNTVADKVNEQQDIATQNAMMAFAVSFGLVAALLFLLKRKAQEDKEMKKVLFIIAITLVLVLSLTACIAVDNVYNDLNNMAEKGYSKIDLTIATQTEGVTLTDTINFLFDTTNGEIDKNNGNATYKTQRLGKYQVVDGILVAPENYIVEKEGSATVKDGKVITQEGEEIYSGVNGLGLNFKKSYFVEINKSEGLFEAKVINPEGLFGAEDMDAVNMSIKVAYSGKNFNRIQISYSTFEGTKVTLNYNFQ